MSEPAHAVVLHRFAVSAERVFDACLDPAWVGRWMFDPHGGEERVAYLTREARVGGKYSFALDRQGREISRTGEYLAIDRPHLLVFTWVSSEDRGDPSRVIIEIAPRDHGCEVKLTQVMSARWSGEIDRAADVWSRRLDALEQAITQDAAAPHSGKFLPNSSS